MSPPLSPSVIAALPALKAALPVTASVVPLLSVIAPPAVIAKVLAEVLPSWMSSASQRHGGTAGHRDAVLKSLAAWLSVSALAEPWLFSVVVPLTASR